MTLQKLVKIGSGDGLLPDATTPSPESMFTYNQRYLCQRAISLHMQSSGYLSLTYVVKLLI